MDKPQKIELLNWLKIIAAFGVVIGHYCMFIPVEGAPLYHSILNIFYRAGGYGIILFFSLSGYTMMMKYKESFMTGEIHFKQYIVPKIVRIWPMHMLMCFVCFLVQQYRLVTGLDYYGYYSNGIGDMVVNGLLMQHCITPDLSLNGPAWTLSVTFFSYLVFYIIMSRYAQSGKHGFFFWGGAIVFSYSLYMTLQGIDTGLPYIINSMQYSCAFFVGCLLFELLEYIDNTSRTKICNSILLFVFTGCFLLFQICGKQQHRLQLFNEGGKTLTLVWIVIPVLLYISTRENIYKWFECKLFKKLNFLNKSYLYIYLCHFPLMLLIQTLKEKGVIEINYRDTSFLIFWFIFVFSSALLFQYIHWVIVERGIKTDKGSREIGL